MFNRVEVNNNSVHGIFVNGAVSTGKINATVAESVAANNGSSGFNVASSSGQAATSLMVVRSVAANNGAGISANSTASNATVRLSQSTVTGNNSGFQVIGGGGAVLSYSDNNIDGNGAGTETPTGALTKK